jgi:hypothetical protein
MHTGSERAHHRATTLSWAVGDEATDADRRRAAVSIRRCPDLVTAQAAVTRRSPPPVLEPVAFQRGRHRAPPRRHLVRHGGKFRPSQQRLREAPVRMQPRSFSFQLSAGSPAKRRIACSRGIRLRSRARRPRAGAELVTPVRELQLGFSVAIRTTSCSTRTDARGAGATTGRSPPRRTCRPRPSSSSCRSASAARSVTPRSSSCSR